MTELAFAPAVKEQSKLRLCLYGPPGGGKTYTGLALALALAGGDPAKLGCVDSEHGSAKKYANVFGPFGHLELPTFSSENYMSAVALLLGGGYLVGLLDSFSHAWEGEGGILDRQTHLTGESNGDSQQGWNKVKPFEKRLWNSVLSADIHMILTLRSRNEWKQYEENGRKKREIVGLEPVQRKGSEYEFDVVCLMEPDEDGAVKLTVEKSRYEEEGEIPRGTTCLFHRKRPEVFAAFRDSVLSALSSGEPPVAASAKEVKLLTELLVNEGKEKKRIDDVLDGERARNGGVLPQAFVQTAIQQALARADAQPSVEAATAGEEQAA